jgi:hypothetical protein
MNIMTRKKLKLSVLFLFGLGLTGLQAQNIHEAIPTSGGNASGSGGTVSYSVGQIVYTNNTGTNGSVSQGVQQPYEISIITSVEEANDISLTISAFPNPTTDYLTLSIVNFDNKNLSFHLYDITGKMIQESKINVSETKITVTDLPPSTYFLKVTDNQKEVKTFKIVKN